MPFGRGRALGAQKEPGAFIGQEIPLWFAAVDPASGRTDGAHRLGRTPPATNAGDPAGLTHGNVEAVVVTVGGGDTISGGAGADRVAFDDLFAAARTVIRDLLPGNDRLDARREAEIGGLADLSVVGDGRDTVSRDGDLLTRRLTGVAADLTPDGVLFDAVRAAAAPRRLTLPPRRANGRAGEAG